MMNYTTHGVCSRAISFEVKDNKVTDVHFVGGCSGNTQAIFIFGLMVPLLRNVQLFPSADKYR